MPLNLSSTAFGQDERIPLRYTRDGENISPPLDWADVPPDTAELALLVDDPDAPRPEPFVHWIIYGLSPSLTGLPEGVPPERELEEPVEAIQGENSWAKIGYDGPAPPRGHGVHHYHFTLYALKQSLGLPAGADKARLLRAMEGKVLAQVRLTGLYER